MGCTCSNDPRAEDTCAIGECQPRVPRKPQSGYNKPLNHQQIVAESASTNIKSMYVTPLNLELVPPMIAVQCSVDDISPLPMLQESESPVDDLSNVMAVAEAITPSSEASYPDDFDSVSSKGTTHRTRSSNLISSETSISWKKEEIEQVAHEMRGQLSSPIPSRRSSPAVRNRRSSNLISKQTSMSWKTEDIDHVRGEMWRQLSLLKYENGSDHHELYNDKLVIQQQQKQIEQLQKALNKFRAQMQ